MVFFWHRVSVGLRACTAAAGASLTASVYPPRTFSSRDALTDRQCQQHQHQQQKQDGAVACERWVVCSATTAIRCETTPEQRRFRYGTIKLRDGRLLAYHEEGPTSGVPVIAFHGMGSSRLTWVSKTEVSEICPGVRLIAVDRPGYGGSTPPPFGYSYTKFAEDVAELADALHLPQFCVAGHSSGGPYALAAAAVLPERVVACAAVSSDAPYFHPNTPPELRASDTFSQPANLEPTGLYGRDPMAFAAEMRNAALAKGDAVKAHAWKSGVDGWVCDWMLERLPWSFSIESITLGPHLTIWAGSVDFEPILIGAIFLQKLVPGSQLRIVPGGNHGFKSKPEHLAAILGELKSEF